MVQPSPGPWWRRAVRWRNWPVLVKLAAVLVVPVLVAVSLGLVQVRGEIRKADAYTAVQKVIALGQRIGPLTTQLQQERTLAVQQPTRPTPAYQRQGETVDRLGAELLDQAKRTPGLSAASQAAVQDLTKLLGLLPSYRRPVLEGRDDGTDAVNSYTEVITSALNLNQSLLLQLGDQELAGPATALLDLGGALEQLRLQQALVLVGIGRGHLLDSELRMLAAAETRFQDRIANFHAVAAPQWQQQYQQVVAGVDVGTRKQLLQFALSAPAEAPATGTGKPKPVPTLNISADEWNRTSEATATLMTRVRIGLGDEIAGTARQLQEDTSDLAGVESVLLVLTLLVAGAVGLVVGRYLLRSLSTLRRSALDVADRTLPEAVAAIRDGRADQVSIEPVPVHTSEEFGQVARAFDKVHGQAVRSAAEQASLRSNLGNIFVNLSRRSQGLVERQLRLMEQLERHEENPEQLANLFKLDHLATRMRRNNENLMVLSGLDLARRFTKPLPLGDVLRAAVSEIEHYQRAVVRSAPEVTVVGYAAGDLVRLIAELLDNATAFSRPDTQVVVDSGPGPEDSVVVRVLDHGIGMGEAELAEANSRVTAGSAVDVPVSRQMGLFVVGRLASRHGFQVRFTPREDAVGLLAEVTVPAELVVRGSRDRKFAVTEVIPVVPDAPEPVAQPEPPAPRIAPEAPAKPPAEEVSWPTAEQAAASRSTWFRSDAAHANTPEDCTEGHVPVTEQGPVQSADQVNPAEPEPVWQDPRSDTPQWPTASVDEGPPTGHTPVVLPKRVPKSGVFGDDGGRGGQRPNAAASRDPNRTRGFLASYQSGIRQGHTDQPVTHDDNERGQQKR
ncbi:hypothetical protein GCM10010174_39220 [Kutzneria viridogrisea]|uniref:histidine kinase n=1 Tax=Kutzneria viridogrisea TaxID=47990 RepID=A0ABR6BMT9_9PSEU|nr:signal transduction histidine kinase [Kutzneria viridogrisea]